MKLSLAFWPWRANQLIRGWNISLAYKHHLYNFVEALAQTIRVGGDCDTNAAIVGGIVAVGAERETIPADWLKAREPIQI